MFDAVHFKHTDIRVGDWTTTPIDAVEPRHLIKSGLKEVEDRDCIVFDDPEYVAHVCPPLATARQDAPYK